jgi:predicted PhzF superfamily epimerase YddE/YHI9
VSARLHVLRVFVGPGGSHGNLLGVFLDGGEIDEGRRQEVARDLGFSETVFVEDAATARVRIFTPAAELGFAGHPLVGTAWLLAHEGTPVDVVHPPAGAVLTWEEGALRWIRGRASWAPAMTIRELADAAAVDRVEGAAGEGFLDAWAWEDRAAGRVRVRVFAPAVGVPEDEATGAAAVRLTDHLGRGLRIRQGRGSEILTRLGPDGTVDVGGRVVLDGVRAYR